MKNVNEHLISLYDFENDFSAVRQLSLENCAGFTVMAQGSASNVETITFRLWAKMQTFNDTDLAALKAATDSEDAGLTSTMPDIEPWILIREDVCPSDTVGEGNSGWAVTDQGFGYKAIKVTASINATEAGLFVAVQASTLTNK